MPQATTVAITGSRHFLLFFLIPAALVAAIPLAAMGAEIIWSPQLLHDSSLWKEGARNQAMVDENGVRLTVGNGHTWELIAQSGIRLPENTGIVRVRVRNLGGGAKWFLKIRGDLRGTGRIRDLVPFLGFPWGGGSTKAIDPRSLRPGQASTFQVQLGLEGPAGAWVTFESIEFLPSTPTTRPATQRNDGQREIETVERMPNFPQPYEMIDWQAVALGYDRLAFDLKASGEYLPLIWIDRNEINLREPTFGLSSYVGDGRPGQNKSNQESITCMGAVLGATVAGVDKSKQEHDYVRMCEAFFNPRQNMVLNNQDGQSHGSFWYDLWPHIVFYGLADRYPEKTRLAEIMRITANRWCDVTEALRNADGVPDFDHTAFDGVKMKPIDNKQWKEPDGAAGVAWLEYAAWTRFRDARHLQAAESCVKFLERCKGNPYYEILLPWGTLAAVRMNAELGRQYDTDRLIRWCFDVSDCREGWGVVVGQWGGYDCSGLLAGIEDHGGYAFTMNTFAQAGALVPASRYDTRYARAIGKWMLNLSNAARLFYPHQHTPEQQSSAFWKGDSVGVIAYEGLRCAWNGQSPYATGDAIANKWGPKTDLGLYGSGYVGLMGGIVRKTNVPGILQLNCLATDFHRQKAWPTFLYYNPHASDKELTVDVGEGMNDLYDAAAHRFIVRDVTGRTKFVVPADRAVVLVIMPARKPVSRETRKLLIDGATVDYDAEGTGK